MFAFGRMGFEGELARPPPQILRFGVCFQIASVCVLRFRISKASRRPPRLTVPTAPESLEGLLRAYDKLQEDLDRSPALRQVMAEHFAAQGTTSSTSLQELEA